MPLISRLAHRLTVQPVSSGSAAPLPENLMKDAIDAIDNRPDRNRVSVDGYLHVSSLLSFCARQRVLLIQNGVIVTKQVTGAHRVIWERGKACEAHVIRQFQRTSISTMFGTWRCACGSLEHYGKYPQDIPACTSCKSKLRHYKGCPLFDHQRRIVGNADMVLVWDGRFVVVEIKSIDNVEEFKNLKNAKFDHIIQGLGYQELLEVNNLPAHPEFIVYYVRSNFRWGSPYKEFHVTANDGQRALIRDLMSQAGRAYQHLKAGTVPDRVKHCTSIHDKPVRECPVGSVCFNLPSGEPTDD